MEKITYRRTLNIGDFETLVIEVTSEHQDLNIAIKLAAQKFLFLAKNELIRIINMRAQTDGSAWSRINLELDTINLELNQLGER